MKYIKRAATLMFNWTLLLTLPVWGGTAAFILAFVDYEEDFQLVVKGKKTFFE